METPGALWQAAAEASEDAVFGVDTAGVVATWTTSAARLFGHAAEQVIGRSAVTLIADGGASAYDDRMVRALAGERCERLPLDACRSDGMVVPISLTLVPLGDPHGVCVVARDLTEQQVAQATLAESELRLQEAQELSHVGLWVWDSTNDALQLSDELYRIHGIDPLAFDGALPALLDIVHPADREELRADFHHGVATGATFEREYRAVLPDSEVRWVYLRAAVETDNAGTTVGLRGIGQDITERKSAAEALRRQASLLELLRRMAVAANEATSVEAALRTCTRDVCAHTGWEVGHVLYVVDGGPAPGQIWHSAQPERFGALRRAVTSSHHTDELREVLAEARPVWMTELCADSPSTLSRAATAAGLTTLLAFPLVIDGEMLAVFEFFSSSPSAPDEELLATVRDGANQLGRVVERMRSRDELSQQARHDALTGLPNRTLLRERLAHCLQRQRRESAYLAVIFLDLDNFKMINDSLGHEVGDELLITIARRLEHVIRPYDTAARFGGDEFIVLCDGLPSPEAAVESAERMLATIAQPISIDQSSTTVINASAGIAIAHDSMSTPEALLRDADMAMYRAKEEGRNRCRVFDAAMHRRAMERLTVANELRAAIEEDQLRLLYQPQIDIVDGQISGVEALVRWQHPTRGLLGPLEFIPLAEETQQIVALGAWILRTACNQAAAWQQLRPEGPGLKLCVNVSTKQLARAEFIGEVSAALAESGLGAANLCVEITESVLMTDADFCLEALLALRLLGVQVAIDDFGTGYSSLAYLRRFPIDIIKVDKGFIDGLAGDDRRGKALVAAVVDLAHALELATVAEGVETIHQVAALEALGCDVAQGYYFARPLAPEDITELLAHTPAHDEIVGHSPLLS